MENEEKIVATKFEGIGENYVKFKPNGKIELLVKNEFFKNAFAFKEGIGEVVRKNNMYNFVNGNGKVISNLDFSYALEFEKNGLALVDVGGGMYNYLRKDGSLVSKENFKEIPNDFEGDIVEVRRQNDLYNFLIIKYGKILFKEDFKKIISDFNEFGIAIVLCVDGKYNFAGQDGSIVFEEGFVEVHKLDKFGNLVVKCKDGLWNFVNPSGKLVSKKWFINVNETFSEFGFTLVEVEKGLFNVVTTCATLVLNNNLNYNQFINALAPDKDLKGN